MNDYDDFYSEPIDFEMQVDEFKSSLMASVKDEYKAEMARLRKENAELKPVKERMREIEFERTREKMIWNAQSLMLLGKQRKCV